MGNPRCPASRGSRVGICKQEADDAREDEIYHTAAFLTFLFTHLPVDAKLKTKGTQHRNIDLFGIGPGSRGSTNLRQDHSVRTEATLASLIVPLLGKFSHNGRNIATVKMTPRRVVMCHADLSGFGVSGQTCRGEDRPVWKSSLQSLAPIHPAAFSLFPAVTCGA
jgi:hypothetical protein